MHERGIGVGVHYPALHLFTAYRKLGYKEGDFPNAERIGRETVTLPLFPDHAVVGRGPGVRCGRARCLRDGHEREHRSTRGCALA